MALKYHASLEKNVYLCQESIEHAIIQLVVSADALCIITRQLSNVKLICIFIMINPYLK